MGAAGQSGVRSFLSQATEWVVYANGEPREGLKYHLFEVIKSFLFSLCGE